MRKYADDQERIIRVKRLADEWAASGLIDVTQHARIVAGLGVDLRRTNRFLRLTLFGFGLLIIAAAVGLIVLTFDMNDTRVVGTLFLMAAAVSVLGAEVLIGRFRLYRFGVEEACAVGAVVLVAAGSALAAAPDWTALTSSDRLVFLALFAGSAAALAAWCRYGYVYAAVGALLCASLAPFHLPLSNTVQRLLAAALFGGCFLGARIQRRRYGDEFPGDEHGTIQASAWLGLYAALNLHLFPRSVARQPVALFYWFTYAMIWILPAAGLGLSIRDRDRPMIAASLVMGLATLLTNKPYLGGQREPWDPILLGLLLIGTALVLRRWLAGGKEGTRDGLTSARLLRSDHDTRAVTALASAAFHETPHPRSDPPAPEPFKGSGGRSGGAGAGGSF